MYVRTKKGEIFDCYESEQMHKPIYYSKKSKTNGYIDYEDVYKKSDNLIDILQVGDYVNGERVINIIKKHKYLEVSDEEIVIDEKDIKSIVTKESMERVTYYVK